MAQNLWKWLVGTLALAVMLLHKQEHQQVVLGFMVMMLTAMNPFAAAGAAFGCCFYLAFPSASRGLQRLLYCVFSWGIGYAAGVFLYSEGPPYSQKSMLVSAVVAAVAVLVFIACGGIIRRDGNLPPWLQQILDVVFPFRAKRGDKDGN